VPYYPHTSRWDKEVFEMPKCFLTGIEIPMENAYLLDCGAAQRALRNLKLRVAAVERIITQLSPRKTGSA
jgi:hypothetical protein